jgi:D-alanyl-D-alanine carboxypeptidase/D-alanyl-D-alanine-endopeptidase (penicillin-binding protein 4)
LGAVASHPLAEVLRFMVQESDNRIADAVFRTVGYAAGRNARWDASAVAVRRALDTLGLDWSGVRVFDGSGLSRHDRVPPRFLAALDAAMTRSPQGALWQDLMAMAGVRGTLEHRLVGSLAQGRVIGKTGTLRDVKSLAGTVTGPEGRYHFAVIGNGLDQAGRLAVQRLQDRVALALARDLEGCFVAPHPGCH